MITEPPTPRRTQALPRPRAQLLLLPFLLLLLGIAGWQQIPGKLVEPIMIFTFDEADDAQWTVVNDGVMGGRSAGFVTVEDGTLRFTGTLVTRGGGFTSVRARRVIDLTGQAGLELRVRGSGRQFEVEVDDGVRSARGSLSRRAPFETSAEWTLVRVPFNTLRNSVFGQAVNAPPIDLARIQGVGLYIADGQDGPFRLEVDFIRAYSADEEPHRPQ
jgi:NADH dehydrogenase [ubiquinone] 1 alpha subcomplex assembly factor 1